MPKYLLLLMGLLAAGSDLAYAKCELGGDPSCFDTGGSSSDSRALEDMRQEMDAQQLGQAMRRQEAEHQESYRRAEPVIVNGPEGSRMYYPSGDGSFYQTYTK